MLTETQNQAKYNVHNIEISVIGIVPIKLQYASWNALYHKDTCPNKYLKKNWI